MATVSKEIAEQTIKRVKNQKTPKVYCVIQYENRIFGCINFAYFENKAEYLSAIQGFASEDVKVLWSSPRFKKDKL